MSPDDLKRLFPNATKSLLAVNPDCSGEASKLERVAGDAALGQTQTKNGDSKGFLVRITSVRKRLLDEDNLCGKYHTDCLRYAGVLPTDAPDKTHIQTTQRKTKKGEEEHTIVDFFEAL